MVSEPGVLGDELPTVLDGRGVDDPVGWVAGECWRQPDGARGNGRGEGRRANGPREKAQPGTDGPTDTDPAVPGEPRQLIPGDRGHGQLVGTLKGLGGRNAQTLGFGRTTNAERGCRRAGCSIELPFGAGSE